MNGVKIAVGCGIRNYGKDWIHIDGGNYSHLDSNDIYITEMDKNSVDLIYASHLINYFDEDELNSVLRAWLRVLKPHGILRIAVPDFKIMSRLYIEKRFELDSFIGPIFGHMKMNDSCIQHKSIFDFKDLSNCLIKAGFFDIHRYNWRKTEHAHVDDHSQAYLPKMDKGNGILISLNIEARKIPFIPIRLKMESTKTWHAHLGMIARCNRDAGYIKRGIRIEDDRWMHFIHFFNDMGECPQWGTLDRIDNNKGYCLENCKWSDRKQQSLNRSDNKMVEYKGIIKPLKQWVDELNLKYSVAVTRLRNGWSTDDAFELPIYTRHKAK